MSDMPKSKRLLELMMTVNRKRRFTVKELANQFQVSRRTILRDLQELSELGVPLYSEVGPHGGYQVLNERVLPPIAFTEEEATAMFFANHALRHYSYLPFETETSSALSKFYHYMPSDVRDRIDQMKNRVDIVAPNRANTFPFLSSLLQAAIQQRVLRIEYESRGTKSRRDIQPVGIYASNGYWYSPAYCFLREDFRIFRCDRIYSIDQEVVDQEPLDLREVHLGNWEAYIREQPTYLKLYVELTREGVQRCEAEYWHPPKLYTREDGSGWIEDYIPVSEISFFTRFFLGLGHEATVIHPLELVQSMRKMLEELLAKYDNSIRNIQKFSDKANTKNDK